MPTANPDDRVRIKNIVEPDGTVQTFWITRYKKQMKLDHQGNAKPIEVPYEDEIEWEFKNGFFFLWGGKAYVMKPGETKEYPRFLANHCMKEQIQYILNKRYDASKRVMENGIVTHEKGILTNQLMKKELEKQIMVEVVEYVDGIEDDFDAILGKKYGGDYESYLNQESEVDKRDVEIEVPDDLADLKKPSETPKERKATDDAALQLLRDECEVMGIEWSDTDTVNQLKARIKKEMA